MIRVLYSQAIVQVEVMKGTPGELQTKAQLERLLKTYDLSRWIFRKSVLIDETVTPHSHPILTLHTRHLKDDELLLSTFIHEQAHWNLTQRRGARQAIDELRKLFPKVPIVGREGAQNEESTYLHLLVCYLEYRGVDAALGEQKALRVMEFWSTDHYTWIYRTVVERGREIGDIALKYRLIPTEPNFEPQPLQ
jgi:hypothetical protein